MKRLGIDIGSTTIKCVVLGEDGEILWSIYERHQSRISLKLSGLLSRVREKFPLDERMYVAFSGSAGMGIAETLGVPFVQEVYATRLAVEKKEKGTDCVIELGGEDAKILFLTDGVEVRMNGSCAGGTGAFIDQMAQLLAVSPSMLNDMAHESQRRYTIASRCGVFAKSDIQPLLNQGARKEDIAASIYYAVVNQTIAGLSQSREIKGNILYLGGPLTFSSYLRYAFDDTLKTNGHCPEDSLLFVSYGSAVSESASEIELGELEERSRKYSVHNSSSSLPALFRDEEEYREFIARHNLDSQGINVT
ncbi:MAG: BadF/BadG/BcrA/BcrD ATPase family protein, partial [Candidatus Ornithospirochaeta sp.]